MEQEEDGQPGSPRRLVGIDLGIPSRHSVRVLEADGRLVCRHAKSNGIDAETLARIPLADPRGLQRLELSGPEAAALDRRIRACERLTRGRASSGVGAVSRDWPALYCGWLPFRPRPGRVGGCAGVTGWAKPSGSWS